MQLTFVSAAWTSSWRRRDSGFVGSVRLSYHRSDDLAAGGGGD